MFKLIFYPLGSNYPQWEIRKEPEGWRAYHWWKDQWHQRPIDAAPWRSRTVRVALQFGEVPLAKLTVAEALALTTGGRGAIEELLESIPSDHHIGKA